MLPDLKQENESVVEKLWQIKGLALKLFMNLGGKNKVGLSFRPAGWLGGYIDGETGLRWRVVSS